MSQVQPGILEPVPPLARYLAFSLAEAGEARSCLRLLREIAEGRQTVVGFGESLTRALDAQIPGLRTPPGIAGRGFEVPSTPFALWCWRALRPESQAGDSKCPPRLLRSGAG